MCRRVTCRTCGKPTWAGCGQHIEEALADVPRNQRCQGHPEGSGTGTPGGRSTGAGTGLFSRLFRK
ncbi:hypothetical protein [Actinomyces polynesiensis]|uniref:hypothetical protein n=1 Tax=Actinomyces polynesiensis TaxID=1325934 RepID=UPI00093AA871|nr:hypothetical protein [Actinomyces polynesiensis]